MDRTPIGVMDKVVKHQRKQKKKCIDPHRNTWDGQLCIAYKNLRDPLGVVISAPFLSILSTIEKTDGDMVWATHIRGLLEIEGFPQRSLHLIYALQKIHDLCKVCSWENEWEQLAVLYDIPLPEKSGQQMFAFTGHLLPKKNQVSPLA